MAEHPSVQTTGAVTAMAVPQWVSRQSGAISIDVLHFLETHPFLLPLLDDAQQAIPSFLPGATMHYELFEDPEDGVTRKLALVIQATGDPEVVADQYYRLIQEWGAEQLPQAWEDMLIRVG